MQIDLSRVKQNYAVEEGYSKNHCNYMNFYNLFIDVIYLKHIHIYDPILRHTAFPFH